MFVCLFEIWGGMVVICWLTLHYRAWGIDWGSSNGGGMGFGFAFGFTLIVFIHVVDVMVVV